MLATWVLVIFFKNGYSGGAVSTEGFTVDSCAAALEKFKEASSYMESADCIDKKTGKVMHINW